jgi:hypothetical protein
MIRIGFSMMFYPVAMGGYILNALKRRDDVELWTVGPFTGSWIPWGSPGIGMHLPAKYINAPDMPLAQNTIRQKPSTAILKNKLPWTPDLFIQVDAGWHFLDRPPGKIVAHVQTDPHVLKAFYQDAIKYSDVTFSMQTPYMQEGEEYLPYAYDPKIHYPMDIDKEYDACMLGLQYPQRDALVARLRSRGLNVQYGIGTVFDEYRIEYNKSKVALSWSSRLDTPTRVYEAMAMKVALVANRTQDLENFFVDGEHYLGFRTLEEAEKQVLLLLSDDEKRTQIAEEGYKAVLPHSWDRRVQTLLETVELI